MPDRIFGPKRGGGMGSRGSQPAINPARFNPPYRQPGQLTRAPATLRPQSQPVRTNRAPFQMTPTTQPGGLTHQPAAPFQAQPNTQTQAPQFGGMGAQQDQPFAPPPPVFNQPNYMQQSQYTPPMFNQPAYNTQAQYQGGYGNDYARAASPLYYIPQVIAFLRMFGMM